MGPPCHLLSLPNELLINILSYLTANDLYHSLLVSKLLHDLITTSTPLLLILEKCLAGVEDNEQCTTLLPSERLAYLRNREKTWGEFNPRWVKKIDIRHKQTGVIELRSGVYFSGREPRDFVRVNESDAVLCLKLPESCQEEDKVGLDGEETTRCIWRVLGLEGKRIKGFRMALEEHDLIALAISKPVEGRQNAYILGIALLRYSTGNYHEEAQIPFIQIHEHSQAQGIRSIYIEITGENLAVIVRYPDQDDDGDHDMLVIYDWKLGTTKTRDPFAVENVGLCFLTETLLVYPNQCDASLDVYHIPYSAENQPVSLILRLGLPAISRDYFISQFTGHVTSNPIGESSLTSNPSSLSSSITNPAPSRWQWQSHSGRYACLTRPFTSLPSQALALFQMDLSPQAEGPTQCFTFVIHRSSLIAEVRKRVRQQEEDKVRSRELASTYDEDSTSDEDQIFYTAPSTPAFTSESTTLSSSTHPTPWTPLPSHPPSSMSIHFLPSPLNSPLPCLTRRVRWRDWGIGLTRWFSEGSGWTFPIRTSGQRFVRIFDEQGEMDGEDTQGEQGASAEVAGSRRNQGRRIMCADFSPRRVRKMESEVRESIRCQQAQNNQDARPRTSSTSLVLDADLQRQDLDTLLSSLSSTSTSRITEVLSMRPPHAQTYFITPSNTNDFPPSADIFSSPQVDFAIQMPFIQHITDRGFDITDVMIEEQRILGLKEDPTTYDVKSLDVMFFG